MDEARKRIVKRDIKLPNDSDSDKAAFILDNVYTQEECEELIKKGEESGFTQALVTLGPGHEELLLDYKDSLRCFWESVETTADMFERIRPYLPAEIPPEKPTENPAGKPSEKPAEKGQQGPCLVGIDKRLQFLKYGPGNYFKFHYDNVHVRPENGSEKSHLTVHLYLNDGYKGGSTTFLKFGNAIPDRTDIMEGDVECKIKTGSLLVFNHDVLHEGSLLHEGTKYTIRGDVMYRDVHKEEEH